MRAKMAAAEVRHERFTPDGPEKEKHTRLFQHVAISDKDTVACGCTNTHRKAFFFFFLQFYLNWDLLCVFGESEELGVSTEGPPT